MRPLQNDRLARQRKVAGGKGEREEEKEMDGGLQEEKEQDGQREEEEKTNEQDD